MGGVHVVDDGVIGRIVGVAVIGAVRVRVVEGLVRVQEGGGFFGGQGHLILVGADGLELLVQHLLGVGEAHPRHEVHHQFDHAVVVHEHHDVAAPREHQSEALAPLNYARGDHFPEQVELDNGDGVEEAVADEGIAANGQRLVAAEKNGAPDDDAHIERGRGAVRRRARVLVSVEEDADNGSEQFRGRGAGRHEGGAGDILGHVETFRDGDEDGHKVDLAEDIEADKEVDNDKGPDDEAPIAEFGGLVARGGAVHPFNQ